MLPRTTQQSYSAALGRESQIEPWLAFGQHAACRRKSSHGTMRKPMLRSPIPAQNEAAEELDVRKNPPLSKEEECFFLTSPFIEPMLRSPIPAQNEAAEELDVRKNPPLSKEEECFFLTSPFIEPMGLVKRPRPKAWATRLIFRPLLATLFLAALVALRGSSRPTARVCRSRFRTGGRPGGRTFRCRG